MVRLQSAVRVKAEFRDKTTGESEWSACRWIPATTRRPLLGTGLQVGDDVAVSYDKVVEHRKASNFEEQ
jgi:hypothetical protein